MSINMIGDWKVSFRLLWGSHFLSVLSSMVIAPLLPFYIEQLGADDQASILMWSGLSLAAPAVSAALTAPLWGLLGDKTSRKWMVVRALFGTALVLTATGLVTSPLQLFILRLLQGALGGVVDAVGTLAASQVKPEEQGLVRGKLEGALAAGSMLGPLLGGTMFRWFGFHRLLLLLGGLVALWTILCMIGLKESRTNRGSTVKSTGLMGQFSELLREKTVVRFLLAGICANFCLHGLLPVLPVHVKQHLNNPSQTAAWIGILQAMNWASAWIASSWWGRRNDRSPVHRTYFLASLLCCTAIVIQAFAPSIAWFIPLRILQGFASSALVQSVFLIVTRSSQSDQLGTRHGLTRSTLFIGQIAGPLASGFFGGFISTSFIFTLHGCMMLAGGFLVLRMTTRKEIRLQSSN
ncbi:MFS transporter [Paenibacillus alba]|nr:MFS transporter [Paenibacillus alba]